MGLKLLDDRYLVHCCLGFLQPRVYLLDRATIDPDGGVISKGAGVGHGFDS